MFEMSHSHFHRNINMKTLNQSLDESTIRSLLKAPSLPKKLLNSKSQKRSPSPNISEALKTIEKPYKDNESEELPLDSIYRQKHKRNVLRNKMPSQSSLKTLK